MLQFNDPTYRRDAIQLAQLIKLDDIRQLNEGSYFGDKLFVAYLELLNNLNKVAIETAKKFGQLKGDEIPHWAQANQNTRRVLVLEQPTWNGTAFNSYELSETIKNTKFDMLIPIVLTAERQAFLVHLDPIRLKATIYVAQHYETNETHSMELSPGELITVDNAFEVDTPQGSLSIIVQISDFVFDLIERLGLDQYRAS